MGKTLLIVVAAILVLNALALAGLATVAYAHQARRRRYVQAHRVVGDGGPQPWASSARHARRSLWVVREGDRPLMRHEAGGIASKPYTRALGGRPAAAVLAGLLVLAGSAMASPDARQAVASAFGTVARGLRLAPSETRAESSTATGTDPGSSSSFPSAGGSYRNSHGAPIAIGTPFTGSASDDSAAHASHRTVPASPATVTAVPVSSSSVGLDWTDVQGETGYRVERSQDGSTGWVTVAIRDHNVTSALDSELLAGTTYYYRIFATNVVRESDPSGVVSATTSVDPASPTTVTASSSSPTQVDLTWTDVADETGYRVERSYDGVTGWMTVGTTGKDVTTFSDTGLPPSTTVYYRVFATNAGGDSAPSDVVRVTTTFETPSDVPAESSP